MSILDLNDNQLTGGIPPELGRLPELNALDLRNNPGLSGLVPASLTEIPKSGLGLPAGHPPVRAPDTGDVAVDRTGVDRHRRLHAFAAGRGDPDRSAPPPGRSGLAVERRLGGDTAARRMARRGRRRRGPGHGTSAARQRVGRPVPRRTDVPGVARGAGIWPTTRAWAASWRAGWRSWTFGACTSRARACAARATTGPHMVGGGPDRSGPLCENPQAIQASLPWWSLNQVVMDGRRVR